MISRGLSIFGALFQIVIDRSTRQDSLNPLHRWRKSCRVFVQVADQKKGKRVAENRNCFFWRPASL